jgi:hypothetical protein
MPQFSNTKKYSYSSIIKIAYVLPWLGRRKREIEHSELCQFVHTWNQVAGRSTTKDEDLYVVLASCLGYRSPSPAASAFRREIAVQKILLSMERLPFSIFFHSTPKQLQGDQPSNRWLPRDISSTRFQEPSRSATTVTLSKQKLVLSPAEESELNADFQLFTVEQTIPLFDGSFSMLVTGVEYRTTPSASGSDPFHESQSNYKSTFVFVEKGSSTTEITQRAACFYSDSLSDGFEVVLTYICVASTSQPRAFQRNNFSTPNYQARCTNPSRQMSINYGMCLIMRRVPYIKN